MALAQNPRDRFNSCRAFADAHEPRRRSMERGSQSRGLLTVVGYPEDDASQTQPASTVPEGPRLSRDAAASP